MVCPGAGKEPGTSELGGLGPRQAARRQQLWAPGRAERLTGCSQRVRVTLERPRVPMILRSGSPSYGGAVCFLNCWNRDGGWVVVQPGGTMTRAFMALFLLWTGATIREFARSGSDGRPSLRLRAWSAGSHAGPRGPDRPRRIQAD